MEAEGQRLHPTCHLLLARLASAWHADGLLPTIQVSGHHKGTPGLDTVLWPCPVCVFALYVPNTTRRFALFRNTAAVLEVFVDAACFDCNRLLLPGDY